MDCVGAWGCALCMSLAYLCMCIKHPESKWNVVGGVVAVGISSIALFHIIWRC